MCERQALSTWGHGRGEVCSLERDQRNLHEGGDTIMMFQHTGRDVPVDRQGGIPGTEWSRLRRGDMEMPVLFGS